MALTKGEKTGIAIAGIATIGGVIAYGLYQQTTAGGVLTKCENQYTKISNLWMQTMINYLTEDNKNGIALTPEQTANLKTIQTDAQNQLQECASIAKTVDGGLSAMESDIGAGITKFLEISGIAVALGVLIKLGRKPKKPSGKPPTASQQFAYEYPIIIQYLLDTKAITPDMASVFSDFTENTLKPMLLEQNQAAYNYYLQQSYIDETLYTALLSESAIYISSTLDIAVVALA